MEAASKKRISIIIVNYQSERFLKKCLASVFSKLPTNFSTEVILVNNDCQENLKDISGTYPAVKIINSQKNIGFGAANNLGARIAQGEVLFFLNPDTELIAGDFERVCEFLQKDPIIAVVGARLEDRHGRIEWWSAGKETNLLRIIKNNLGFPGNKKIWENKENTFTDFVSGAAMFVRKKAFQKINGFDENFFLYFEDEDLCKKVRKQRYKVLYHPAFVIRHHGGGSTKSRKDQKEAYYKSQDYYFQKYLSKTQARLLKVLRKANG